MLKVHNRLFEYQHAKYANKAVLTAAGRMFNFFHLSRSLAAKAVRRNSLTLEDMSGAEQVIDCDPIAFLPSEIGQQILAFVNFRQRYTLQRVSKLWKAAIASSWALCTSIDFRGCNCVPGSAVVEAINRSKGAVTEIYLQDIVITDIEWVAFSLFHDDYESRFEILKNQDDQRPSFEYEYDNLQNVRMISLDYPFSLIQPFLCDWSDSGAYFKQISAQLVELHMSAINCEEFLQYFAHGNLPNLQILKLVAPHSARVSKHVSLNGLLTEPGNPQNQLRVFEIGAPLPDDDTTARGMFDFNSDISRLRISRAGLFEFLAVVPNLEEFYCRMSIIIDELVVDQVEVDHNQNDDQNGNGDDDAAADINAPLNDNGFLGILNNMQLETTSFATLLPKLAIFDASWSQASCFTNLPASCRVINVNCCSGVCDHTNLRIQNVIPALSQASYIGFACVRAEDSAAQILNTLVERCDAQSLECINLGGNRQIDYESTEYVSFFSGQYRMLPDQRARKVAVSTLPGVSFLEAFVEAFSSVRSLAIGFNSSLGDTNLLQLRKLRHLQFLDISSSRVTVKGLMSLIFGEEVGRFVGSNIANTYQGELHRVISEAVKKGKKLGNIHMIWVRGCTKIPNKVDVITRRYGVAVIGDRHVSRKYNYPLLELDNGYALADVPGWFVK